MAHSYRTLHNWDQWLANQFLGNKLLEEEGEQLSRMLKTHYGKHAVLIGVPHQASLLTNIDIPFHTLMCPPISYRQPQPTLESDLHELPMLSGSVDLVVLPHTLEFVDNPRHLFSEACRIVKPEGLIAIIGFNPYSAWGLRRMPYTANLMHAQKIKGWLKLEDFMVENQQSTLFRPPVNYPGLYQKLHFIEKLGRVCFPPLGGAYVLLARAKVIPLTPIRLKWKQQLSQLHIPSTISGHIARQTK